jgi:hypothetical protein
VGADDCTLCVARTRKERNLRGEFSFTPVKTLTMTAKTAQLELVGLGSDHPPANAVPLKRNRAGKACERCRFRNG